MQKVPLAARRDLSSRLAVGALVATLLFVALFWRLGAPSFWDPDEAHYAETSREMVTSGDWWAPYYNEQPFFDKPVLFHQLQGLAMALSSDPEFAARIVPALAGLGLVAMVAWFGRTMIARDVGLVGGLMFAASPGLFTLARYAILDTLFSLFLFGAAALLTVAALRDRPRLQWPGYACLAFAVLTKGPIALVLCGLTFLVAILISSELRARFLALHWAAGLALVLVVTAPPFVYLYREFGEDFVNGYVLDENLRLFASSRFGNQPGYSFYFRILAAGLLPWTGLLAGRLVDDIRASVRGERLDAVEVLLWVWTATIVGLFTLSTFKLDHYVFPAAPALCLLCARAWSDARAEPLAARHRGARVGLHLIAPFLVVVGLASGYLLIARLALPWAALVVPIALTTAGVALAAPALRRAPPPRLPWIALVAIVVTYGGLIVFVLPALERRKVVPDLAQWVATRAQPTDRIASFRLNRWNPAYRFYVGRHTTFLDDASEARAFFDAPQPFFCVMRRDAFDELAARGAPIQIVHEREGTWATSGRALWRTDARLTRFVVVTRPQ